ncbi:hypothetical protein AAC387_Pa05g0019 [Persea americana]
MPKNIQKKKTCRKRFVECVTGTLHIAQEDINNDRVAMVFGQDDCGRVRGLGLGVSRSTMHHLNPYKRAYKEEHKLHVALETEVDGLKSPMADMEKTVASLSQSGTQMWSSIDHESSSRVRPPCTHQETPRYKLMHYRKNTIVANGNLMGVSPDNLDYYKFILDEIMDGDIKLVDGVSKMEDLVPRDIIIWPTFRTFLS